MLSTLRTLAQRVGVPLTASLLSAPFLVGRAAAFWAKEAPAPPPGFMGLSLQNFTPYHCLFGGLLLGVSTAMSMLIRGDVLGISGIVGGVVKGKHHEPQRWLFLAGLLTGAAALKTLYPAGLGSVEAPLWRVLVSGLLVGAGAAIGNGCTSGHGICGNSRLSTRSMAYTLVFMASGAATATLLKSGSTITYTPAGPPIDDTSGMLSLAVRVLGAHVALYVGILGLAAKVFSQDQAKHALWFLDGSLFALGLGLSSMTSPVKVAQFLDFSGGRWDPSLMFVMGGALLLNVPVMQGLVMNGTLKKPMWGKVFAYPPAGAIDSKLIQGGVLFGVGWGMGGACPGPALVNLVHGHPLVMAWNAAMMCGIFLGSRLW